MYYGGRKHRKFDYKDEAPKGVSKRAIRMIILLLFLIAAFLFLFPNPSEADGREGSAWTRLRSSDLHLHTTIGNRPPWPI
jgi:hypothetical protein